MKFKTLMLSSTLLVFAALFSYCSKETQTPDLKPVATNTDSEAASRGVCKVLVTPAGTDVTVCGSQNNATICSPGLFGTDFINVNNTGTYVLNTPTSLIITQASTPGPIVPTVTVKTAGGLVVYAYPHGSTSLTINIDNNCVQF